MLYKETSGVFTSYRRAYNINISNQYNSQPHMAFNEEDVTILPNGELLRKNIITPLVEVYNPNKSFPLINPETDEPLGGTITHAELMVSIYSLYKLLATERDVAELALQNPPAQAPVNDPANSAPVDPVPQDPAV